jgi:hypothetical protein
MSHTFMSGLVGVSIHNMSKGPASRSKAAASVVSTKAKATP